MSWPTIELGDLMPGRGTTVDPSKYLSEEFDLFSIPAYDSQIPDCVLGGDIGSSKQVVQPGDVLLSKIVPHIRRAWIVPGGDGRRQIGSSEWIIFRSPKFYGPYLRHVLLSDQFNSRLMQTVSGVGGSLLRARPTSVSRLKISLPPVDEQQRIAAVLDRAEELRAKRRAAIALLEQLPQAIFLEMFGEPTRNPMGWPVASFGMLGNNEDSKRVPIKSSERAARQGPFPYYGASGPIDWFDDYIFDGTRLLIGEDGANLIARSSPIAFLACGKYWVNNHAHVIADSGRSTLRFLENFILMTDLKPFVSGSAQPKLTKSSLDSIPVPCPPISLQKQFDARIESVLRNLGVHESALRQLDGLFGSIQAKAFGMGAL